MSYPYNQQGYPGQYGQPPPQQYPSQGGYSAPQGQQLPPGGHYPPPAGHYPPPQGQYPPPHSPYPPQQGGYTQSYGVPPPNQGYGAAPPGPPPGQYGTPPPVYGAPQYGAPQYSAPQYGTPQYGAPQYGAPPSAGPPTPASLGYGPPQIIQWDARPDAQALRGAMKGFGTDEKTLIRVLATKDPLQIEAIKDAYSRHIGRNLQKDIESETKGWLETGLVALVRGPLLHDAHLLREAISGPGTNEDVLNDVLLGRSNADMHAIKSMYQREFGRSLEADVRGDLSLKTEQHFMIVLGASRAEESAPVVPQAIDQEVQEIYRATEGKTGTDEILVCSILSTRSDSQIRAINDSYERQFRKRLEDVIRKEFSGHMKDALLYQLRSAINKPAHAAKTLEDAMAGLGTKDHLLVSRVVRYHWDQRFMADVKRVYQDRYRTSLASRIKGETSGDYEKLMLACIGERV
ncbi:hypothetical protein DL764_008360 [Monosporascus ibericus]|uniref:Annexin n=1 Tax=Monosporascus ibericus TaxID=155417 RepID=A0A4Q4SXP6_9PEZI|nr:hypothetical protein DL764_008360 [Monosporascus ibericus]